MDRLRGPKLALSLAHSHALQSPIVTSRGKRTSNKTAIVPGECSWKSAYCLCNKLDVVYLTI
jgi:hypothetical protein